MRFNLFLTIVLSVLGLNKASPVQAMNLGDSDKKTASNQAAFSPPNEDLNMTSTTIVTSYNKQISQLEKLIEDISLVEDVHLKEIKVVQRDDCDLGWDGLKGDFGYLLSERVKANPDLNVTVEFKVARLQQPKNGAAEENFNYFKTVIDAYSCMSKLIWHFDMKGYNWKHIVEGYYGDYPFPQKVLDYCLGRFPRLTHLELDRWDFREFSGASTPDQIHFPALESLKLTYCHLWDENLEILLKIFPVENIKVLDLSYSTLDAPFIDKYLSQFKSLTSLKIMDMCELTWKTFHKIQESNPALKELSLGTFGEPGDYLESIVFKQLDSLYFEYKRPGPGRRENENYASYEEYYESAEFKELCAIDEGWLKRIFRDFTCMSRTRTDYETSEVTFFCKFKRMLDPQI